MGNTVKINADQVTTSHTIVTGKGVQLPVLSVTDAGLYFEYGYRHPHNHGLELWVADKGTKVRVLA